jgi:homoaconitate hydratase
MSQNTVEKIAQRFAMELPSGHVVRAGDFLAVRPKHIMTHDNTGAVIPKFASIGATRIADPTQPVFAMDHDVQNTSAENLGKYARIEKFAREQGVDFYPPGRGIAHQVMVEEGYVTPGAMVVGSDSHSNLYGACCALGTPVVRTDAAAIWATGKTWWQVPPVARVELQGKLGAGVTGKDVIITLCGHFNTDEVLNHCVEFLGEGVAGLSMDQRLTISNMTTEWGVLAGLFPFDEVLRDFLVSRARFFAEHREKPRYTEADVARWWSERGTIGADEGAHYARTLTLDLASVSPHVSGPNNVKTMRAIASMGDERVRIDKAYLLSCVNARVEDLSQAARVVEGKRFAASVEFYLAPASSEVREESIRRGDWKILLEAGAIELPPGCGACIGLGRGTLEAGEVGISATNRNFEGRMGSREALCYLASPPVVAASALAGYICAPEVGEAREVVGTCTAHAAPDGGGDVSVRDDFPARVEGRALWLGLDNLNTDGIYSKDVTYRDDITLAQQGQYAMLNYDPEFQSIAQEGDIIVSGYNFGTGSSREQAATALASRGIQLVIAGSFSQTYKRNAFNNGFICLECPALVDDVRAAHAGDGARTVVADAIRVDYANSVIEWEGREYAILPLSPIAQELVVAGGSEALVRAALHSGNE